MQDVMDILGMDIKRAEELMEKCYAKLAELQERPDNGQLSESIKHMFEVGQTNEERFFTGYLLGRIVQINETLHDESTPVVLAHLEQLAKAKDGRKSHPEFV